VETFQATVAYLRAPDGCPWDREQTHQSLRKGFQEEAYEVLDALDRGDLEGLKEELGDVLLHILLQAQIATEEDEFTMSDLVCYANRKIVSRHPHVFGDLAVDGVGEVLANWEDLKRREKGRDCQGASLFEGIPLALPALARTQAMLRRAGGQGVDPFEGMLVEDSIAETWDRVTLAQDAAAKARRLGDLLFGLSAYAALAGIDAEGALRDANARFEHRVSGVGAKPGVSTPPELTAD
jgi:tetrapyrrole methylase family protein/MazG family protein